MLEAAAIVKAKAMKRIRCAGWMGERLSSMGLETLRRVSEKTSRRSQEDRATLRLVIVA